MRHLGQEVSTILLLYVAPIVAGYIANGSPDHVLPLLHAQRDALLLQLLAILCSMLDLPAFARYNCEHILAVQISQCRGYKTEAAHCMPHGAEAAWTPAGLEEQVHKRQALECTAWVEVHVLS